MHVPVCCGCSRPPSSSATLNSFTSVVDETTSLGVVSYAMMVLSILWDLRYIVIIPGLDLM